MFCVLVARGAKAGCCFPLQVSHILPKKEKCLDKTPEPDFEMVLDNNTKSHSVIQLQSAGLKRRVLGEILQAVMHEVR